MSPKPMQTGPREMHVVAYEAAWKADDERRIAASPEDRAKWPSAEVVRASAMRDLERGVGNCVARLAWAGVQPNDMTRLVIATVARYVLWAADPEAGAAADARLFGSDPEVRRGDE